MKRSIILIVSVFITLSVFAQNKEKVKQTSDTTKTCKPSKSGKHCSKPNN